MLCDQYLFKSVLRTGYIRFLQLYAWEYPSLFLLSFLENNHTLPILAEILILMFVPMLSIVNTRAYKFWWFIIV